MADISTYVNWDSADSSVASASESGLGVGFALGADIVIREIDPASMVTNPTLLSVAGLTKGNSEPIELNGRC